MPITYSYSARDRLVSTHFEGDIEASEIFNYLNEVLNDTSITSGFIEVVNLEEVDNFTISFRQAMPFQEIWRQYVKKGCAGTILFAPRDAIFGVCRVIQAAVSSELVDNGGPFEVVREKSKIGTAVEKIQGK